MTFVKGLSFVHEEYPVMLIQIDSAGCLGTNLLYSTLKTLDTVASFCGGSTIFGVADVSEHCRILPSGKDRDRGSWLLSSRRTVIHLSVNPQSPRVRDTFSLVIAGISMSFPSVNVPEARLESPVTYADVGLVELLEHKIYGCDIASSHWPERV